MKVKKKSKSPQSKSRATNRVQGKSQPVPFRKDDLLVTRSMLMSVKDELKKTIDSKFNKLKSEIHGVKSEIHGVKSEIHGIKSEIHGIKSEIHGIKSEIHGIKSEINGLKAEVHRLGFLIEEQNVRNSVVFDAIKVMIDRQDRLENRFDSHEKFVVETFSALKR